MPLGHGFEHYLGIPYSVDMGYSAWRPNKGNFPPLPLVEAVSARPCLGVRVPGPTEIVLGSAAIGSQWVQPFRHGDPIGTLGWLRFPYESTFVRSHHLHPHPYARRAATTSAPSVRPWPR